MGLTSDNDSRRSHLGVLEAHARRKPISSAPDLMRGVIAIRQIRFMTGKGILGLRERARGHGYQGRLGTHPAPKRRPFGSMAVCTVCWSKGPALVARLGAVQFRGYGVAAKQVGESGPHAEDGDGRQDDHVVTSHGALVTPAWVSRW